MLDVRRQALAKNHREQRWQLKQTHAKRWTVESKTRSARLPTGLKALWFRVTGKYRQIKKQMKVKRYAAKCEINPRSKS